MNKFNVEIWETYNACSYSVTFIKTITLPFAPFYGLEISEVCDEEFVIDSGNAGGIRYKSQISWDGNQVKFVVDKSHYMDISKWTMEVLEGFINDRTESGWTPQKQNTHDLNIIKELLKRKEEACHN